MVNWWAFAAASGAVFLFELVIAAAIENTGLYVVAFIALIVALVTLIKLLFGISIPFPSSSPTPKDQPKGISGIYIYAMLKKGILRKEYLPGIPVKLGDEEKLTNSKGYVLFQPEPGIHNVEVNSSDSGSFNPAYSTEERKVQVLSGKTKSETFVLETPEFKLEFINPSAMIGFQKEQEFTVSVTGGSLNNVGQGNTVNISLEGKNAKQYASLSKDNVVDNLQLPLDQDGSAKFTVYAQEYESELSLKAELSEPHTFPGKIDPVEHGFRIVPADTPMVQEMSLVDKDGNALDPRGIPDAKPFTMNVKFAKDPDHVKIETWIDEKKVGEDSLTKKEGIFAGKSIVASRIAIQKNLKSANKVIFKITPSKAGHEFKPSEFKAQLIPSRPKILGFNPATATPGQNLDILGIGFFNAEEVMLAEAGSNNYTLLTKNEIKVRIVQQDGKTLELIKVNLPPPEKIPLVTPEAQITIVKATNRVSKELKVQGFVPVGSIEGNVYVYKEGGRKIGPASSGTEVSVFPLDESKEALLKNCLEAGGESTTYTCKARGSFFFKNIPRNIKVYFVAKPARSQKTRFKETATTDCDFGLPKEFQLGTNVELDSVIIPMVSKGVKEAKRTEFIDTTKTHHIATFDKRFDAVQLDFGPGQADSRIDVNVTGENVDEKKFFSNFDVLFKGASAKGQVLKGVEGKQKVTVTFQIGWYRGLPDEIKKEFKKNGSVKFAVTLTAIKEGKAVARQTINYQADILRMK